MTSLCRSDEDGNPGRLARRRNTQINSRRASTTSSPKDRSWRLSRRDAQLARAACLIKAHRAGFGSRRCAVVSGRATGFARQDPTFKTRHKRHDMNDLRAKDWTGPETASAAVSRPAATRIFPARPAATSPTTSPNSARRIPTISASASPPSTAMSTRSATAGSPSPSSRCQSRSCSRWRWTRWALRGWRARSASNRRAIPSTRSGSTPTTIRSIRWSMPARSPAPA